MALLQLRRKEDKAESPSKKPSSRIENVVASVIMNQTFDLNAILRSVPGAEYNPEKFPGLVYRISKPHTATLIFSTGKMVCTGAKSVKEVHAAVKKIVANLKGMNIVIIGTPEITIQNIVASANLYAEVNLEKAAFLLDNVMYEPEQFPGLIYRMADPKVVLLIFSSGKMVCTGAKREDEVQAAAEKIGQKLLTLGVLYE
jgi:transcription initiation factor TFIID TATA-box-binding protein